MSLRGSLETFELRDVLTLVASTTKTGALEVTTDRGVGRLAFADGQVVGADMDDLTAPVEVLARLLRAESGDFTFDARVVDDGATTVDVPGLLADADALVAEWTDIERVVPSPHALVTLAAVPPAATFSVSAEEWTLVAAIAGGCTVHELARFLGVDDLGASRGVKKLVEAGLVVVEDAAVDSGTRNDNESLTILVPEREKPDEDAADASVLVRQLASLTGDDGEASEEEPAPAKGDGEEPLSRGTLLKFLSSVRT